MENMIVVPITKKMEIIMSIQVCLISGMNINYKENGGKKRFSCKSKASISCIPVRKTWLSCPLTKKMRLLRVSKFVSFHEWILIIRKIEEKKAFLTNPKPEYRVSYWGGHDCSGHNKTNGDFYEYPSLSHFTDKLWLQGKWSKENYFLQILCINIVHPNEENMIVVRITKRIEIITIICVCLISRMNINYK